MRSRDNRVWYMLANLQNFPALCALHVVCFVCYQFALLSNLCLGGWVTRPRGREQIDNKANHVQRTQGGKILQICHTLLSLMRRYVGISSLITLTHIVALSGKLKGFMVQVRTSSGSSVVGRFTTISSNTAVICNGQVRALCIILRLNHVLKGF